MTDRYHPFTWEGFAHCARCGRRTQVEMCAYYSEYSYHVSAWPPEGWSGERGTLFCPSCKDNPYAPL